MFEKSVEELTELGAQITTAEIAQQPELWRDTLDVYKRQTYKQAMTAYYTAYQQYSSQASSASSKWTEYANGLYAKANISIYGLFA